MTISKRSIVMMAAAFADSYGIGLNNKLPWHIPDEFQYFEHVTTKSYAPESSITEDSKEWDNIVIMGRKSYEASPMLKIPLKNRHNIIISRNKAYKIHEEATLVSSLDEALAQADCLSKKHTRIFLLGGQTVYESGIRLPECSHILLTHVYYNSPTPIICDTFFPSIDKQIYRLAHHTELEAFLKKSNIPKGRQTYMNFEYEFLLYVRI